MEASDSFFFMSNRFILIWFKTKKEAYLYMSNSIQEDHEKVSLKKVHLGDVIFYLFHISNEKYKKIALSYSLSKAFEI